MVAKYISSAKDLSSFARTHSHIYGTLAGDLYKRHATGTVLLWALEKRLSWSAEMTIRVLKDANVKDNVGRTPLSIAAKNGLKKVAELLIQTSTGVDVPDYLGRVPLSWAAEKGHDKIVVTLLQAGALIDYADGFGWTALSWAAKHGHNEVVRLLVDHGARVQIHGLPRIQILDVAAQRSHPDILIPLRRILSRRGFQTVSTRRRWVRNQLLRSEPICYTDPLSLARLKGHQNTIDFLDRFQSVPPITSGDCAADSGTPEAVYSGE